MKRRGRLGTRNVKAAGIRQDLPTLATTYVFFAVPRRGAEASADGRRAYGPAVVATDRRRLSIFAPIRRSALRRHRRYYPQRAARRARRHVGGRGIVRRRSNFARGAEN